MTLDSKNQQANAPEESPQVFDVQKDTSGFKFSRRDVLITGATVAAAGALAGCSTPKTPTVAPTRTRTPTKATTPTRTPTPLSAAERAALCQRSLAHTDEVSVLAFSADGTLLVSGGKDKTIKIWSVADGALLKTITGPTGTVYMLVISPDGKLLVSSGEDRLVRAWSLPDGKPLELPEPLGSTAKCFSPDGGMLVTGVDSEKSLKIWSVPGFEWLNSLMGHTGTPYEAVFTPDGKLIATSAADNTVRLWSLEDVNVPKTLTGPTDAQFKLAISPDGKMLAACGMDKTVWMWSLPDGTPLKPLTGHADIVFSLWFSPDSKMLLSGASNETRLWSLPDGKLLTTIKATSSFFPAITSDGKLMACVDGSNITLWSLPDGKLVKTLKGHTDTITFISLSPDDVTLASGGKDKSVKLWSIDTDETKACLLDLAASPSDVKGIKVEGKTSSGEAYTYTLPCGAPIPAGATCTCNCVGGGVKPASPGCSCVSYTSCSCVSYVSGGSHYWHPN